MSKEKETTSKKRKPGRPRLYGENLKRRGTLVMRKDLITQMDAEIETHSKVLGFKINRQQFIEILLNSWRDK